MAAKKREGTYEPSQYQKAIFDYIEHEKGNLVDEAAAGSGTAKKENVKRRNNELNKNFDKFLKNLNKVLILQKPMHYMTL